MREKEEAFTRYEKAYIKKRNDNMFVFKFIAPYVTNFYNIKANHGIALFVMSKKAYIDLNQFKKDMMARKDIFGFKRFFEEFTNSVSYKNML